MLLFIYIKYASFDVFLNGNVDGCMFFSLHVLDVMLILYLVGLYHTILCDFFEISWIYDLSVYLCLKEIDYPSPNYVEYEGY